MYSSTTRLVHTVAYEGHGVGVGVVLTLSQVFNISFQNDVFLNILPYFKVLTFLFHNINFFI